MADPKAPPHPSRPEEPRRWAPGRRAPERVQSSPMDCGPVALWSLLSGLGLDVPYDGLREACRTGVDGTSIRALEAVLAHFDVPARQVLAPKEHLGHPAANLLPAIAVTRQTGGAMHFVLLWRLHRGRIEVMDPASGRRRLRPEQLAAELYEHPLAVEAETWRRLALSNTARLVLGARLQALGLRAPEAAIERCATDLGWRSIAALEASARLVEGLIESRALPRGQSAAALAERLFEAAQNQAPNSPLPIPGACWSALPEQGPAGPTGRLSIRGALLLHVDAGSLLARARRPSTGASSTDEQQRKKSTGLGAIAQPGPSAPRPTGPSIEAALQGLAPTGPDIGVVRRLWELFRPLDRRQVPGLLALALSCAGLVLLQALALRAMLDVPTWLALWPQRFGAGFFLGCSCLLALGLELALAARGLGLGRRLETRLRIAVQRGLPRMSGRWFGSRPASDLAERAQSLFFVHELPLLVARVVKAAAGLLFTGLGLIVLDPGAAPGVLLILPLAVGLPWVLGRRLNEQELRVRGHQGALMRFHLEALSGLIAVRVHGAERALVREHESLLVEWARAGQDLARAGLALRAIAASTLTLLSILLVAWHLYRNGATPAALLFGYWTLSLPAFGDQLALSVLLAAPMGNAARRALEPINAAAGEHGSPALTSGLTQETPPATRVFREQACAPIHAWPSAAVEARAAGRAATLAEVSSAEVLAPPPNRGAKHMTPDRVSSPMGVGIQLADVYLELGGRRVLEQIQLQIQPGEHLALLGRSGAGKSSLLNLLLGFEQPSQGAIAIDGEALSIAAGEAERADSTLARLRRSTAWVDPTVQLWNQSAFQNLLFGRDGVSAEELVQALAECDAAELIAALPAGLATPLGESGTRLSGGEGQRLRLARAWLQGEARLVLLDEPFRGLERSRRRQLLQRLRQRFQRATLITVTHDVASALDFDRVAVLEAGRLVECDRPALLKARPDSRFNALLQAERQLLEVGYGDLGWRRLQVVNGRLETEG